MSYTGGRLASEWSGPGIDRAVRSVNFGVLGETDLH